MPAQPTISGVDVSSHQAGYKPGAGIDFVFVKATEGRGYVNPAQGQQVGDARRAGCVVGFYHFLHPGHPEEQAAYFVQHAASVAGDLLVCDWETVSGKGHPSNADKDAFMKELKRLRPDHRVGLYCNTYSWRHIDTTSYRGDFLWIAAYGVRSPGIEEPYLFWQYSDSGGIDKNLGFFPSKAALRAWAGGGDDLDTKPTGKIAPTAGSIHTPYGARGINPATGRSWWSKGYHPGDDWHDGPNSAGNPIYAVADGLIRFAGDARRNGGGWGPAFGIHVLNTWTDKLPGEDFHRTSIDAHMTRCAVRAGQRVRAGDIIGYLGATGNVSGPHDHHEQHAGPGWTDKDLRPVYPSGTDHLDPAPTRHKDKDDDMQPSISSRHRGDQPLAPGKWKKLKTTETGYSLAGSGPARYDLIANVAAKGLQPGEEILVRAVVENVGTSTYRVISRIHTEPALSVPGTYGGTCGSGLPFQLDIPEGSKGCAAKVQIEAATWQPKSKGAVTITDVTVNYRKQEL